MLAGRPFWKLTGSGNDFVFFDVRASGAPAQLLEPTVIGALCDRRSGVGADGIVLFEPGVEAGELYSIRYFNRDGSLAEMCGNAALCSVRLGQILGVIGPGQEFAFHTTSGRLAGTLVDGEPRISMPPPRELNPACQIALADGEQRIGFVRVGVPHLVLVAANLAAVDVLARGRALRRDPSLRDGANVNFIAPAGPRRWAMRTYERGVEAETLACGSGAVAVAAMLTAWGLERDGTAEITVLASGGRELGVRWREPDSAPFLRGEGRLVFSGQLANPLGTTAYPAGAGSQALA